MEAVHWLLVVAANWDGGKQPRQDNYKRDDGIDQDDQDEQNQTENRKPKTVKIEGERAILRIHCGWVVTTMLCTEACWRNCYALKIFICGALWSSVDNALQISLKIWKE